jgi:NAD(P)-dependent dehydrogenase (short-subunit alcohol dehydrogenase family)
MKKKEIQKNKNAIIIGVGSDIGREIANKLLVDGWNITGTYRSRKSLEGLNKGIAVIKCDLTKLSEIKSAVKKINLNVKNWDLIVIGVGTEEPIGSFWSCNANEWDLNIGINALYPLRFIRKLYKTRNAKNSPAVAFFSGSGTNGAPVAYSAYCVSKMLLIKMCEILDAESEDTNFFIIETFINLIEILEIVI